MMGFITILAIVWFIYEVRKSCKNEGKIRQFKKIMKKADKNGIATCDREELNLWSDKELQDIIIK